LYVYIQNSICGCIAALIVAQRENLAFIQRKNVTRIALEPRNKHYSEVSIMLI